MKQKRPVNLDLTSLTYPPMAIASILHRLTGILLFLVSPWILYLLSTSLASDASFQSAKLMTQAPFCKFLLWAVGSSLIYHLFAGIRHILMDIGLGETLEMGRRTAVVVILLAAVCAIFLGIWIW